MSGARGTGDLLPYACTRDVLRPVGANSPDCESTARGKVSTVVILFCSIPADLAVRSTSPSERLFLLLRKYARSDPDMKIADV